MQLEIQTNRLNRIWWMKYIVCSIWTLVLCVRARAYVSMSRMDDAVDAFRNARVIGLGVLHYHFHHHPRRLTPSNHALPPRPHPVCCLDALVRVSGRMLNIWRGLDSGSCTSSCTLFTSLQLFIHRSQQRSISTLRGVIFRWSRGVGGGIYKSPLCSRNIGEITAKLFPGIFPSHNGFLGRELCLFLLCSLLLPLPSLLSTLFAYSLSSLFFLHLLLSPSSFFISSFRRYLMLDSVLKPKRM